MYLNFSRVVLAHKVFDHLPQRDTVLWNTMVSGLVRNRCYNDSIPLIKGMIGDECPFDSTTLADVLPAATELQDLYLKMELQCLALKLGFHSHVHVLTGLISLHSKCGSLASAKLLFSQVIAYGKNMAADTEMFFRSAWTELPTMETWLRQGQD